jgi:hypothetical protein
MRRPMLFIHLFLIAQLALPLWYYAGRPDKNDERFAWRMFSSTRMIRCETQFTVGEDERLVRLFRTFHEAWVTIARRGRLEVIEAMAAKLCADHPGEPVRVRARCRLLDGSIQEHGGGWDLCATRRL